MPELPEVETVKKALKELVIDKQIEGVEVNCEKIIKNMSAQEFAQRLKEQTIRDIRRYGKYLFFDFDDYTLVSHLRMEGKYNYSDKIIMPGKHDHVVFYFSDASMLCFNDTRKFGTMELVKREQESELSSVSKLGLEPFSPQMDVDYLVNKASNRTIAIKSFLLNQEVMTGLGNIYVDEVLFASGIHPQKVTNTLSEEEFKKILANSKKILKQAIAAGGTTVHSFLVTGDISGKFQNQLKVYGRQGQPCLVCSTPINKIRVGGRGTHFCPECQKR